MCIYLYSHTALCLRGLTFCDVRQCFLADNVYFVWAVSEDAYLCPLGRDYYSHHPTSNFLWGPSFPGNLESFRKEVAPSLTCWARAGLVVYTLQTHKVLTVCRSSNRKLTEIQARLTIRRPAITLCQNRNMSRVWVFCSMRSSISCAILHSLVRLSVHLLYSYMSRALNLHLSSSTALR